MGLNQHNRTELTRLGERIQKTFIAVSNALPEHAQTIGGFAKLLEYNRSNSQRFFAACKASSGLQVLVELPGTHALQILSIKLSPLLPSSLMSQVNQVVELFAQCIENNAKSHADLKRLIQSPKKVETHSKESDHKAQLYHAAKALLKFSVEEVFCIYILRENQNDPSFLQEVTLISKSGIERLVGAVPFVQFYTHPHPEHFDGPIEVTGDTALKPNEFTLGVSKEFSSDGFLQAFSTYSPSNSGLVFDPLPSRKSDVTFVFNNPDEVVNPLDHKSPCSSTSLSIKNPVKKLTMLVLLEKQIDRCSTVNIGCYHSNQKVEEGKLKASDLWTERFPEFPELKITPLENDFAHSLLPENQKDKLRYLLNVSGIAADNFICYATEVDYPIWSSTYRIYFEHQ
ncbi:hypothetical protein [Pseudoalteromonas luteoviolacea]|uniref:Uncharacterized protein n=1 Tax=Pseudoalteromonas luteoviolacea S4054 TaxID=1129367 RepID=A0A0F6AG81_9GAMM|nr:hypothetical protein [Pseudoalteromonas luteoviolacea]AOT08076.1 hypothetical protein S4054249_09545 [Pseudoalteromonas luteoviolacea]AOT12993.1 hypothetical protein S40542_09545 [Pseudoalteromonas luteoviolacea]AOT17905.1 hypothetical protein S4054_09540 [Pseudoalteromonas luteoviolacea]KKE84374.1 hypothetical protein N479_09020 [Pseudoalteromonas luteoviolacea S4054]KZN71749.1 hypothetical protein N481_17560 [Pseudoalteromonas luteoviolacea S4047-1]